MTALYSHFKGKEPEAWKGRQRAHSRRASNCKTKTQTWLSPPRSPGALAVGGPLRITAWFPLGVALAPIWDSETLLNGQVETGSAHSDDSDIITFLHLSVHSASVAGSQMEGWRTGLDRDCR